MKIKIIFLFSLFFLQSIITFSQVDLRSLYNVKAFSKVFGYVRYFYPGDEATSIDWDQFAVYGINSVINIKNTDTLKEELNELFLPIAPLININQIVDTTQGFYKPKIKKLEHVSWQYLGFENEFRNGYYKCRTNRPHRKNVINKKMVIMTINAAAYLNDTIRITAKIKIKRGSKGYGYLLFQQRDQSNNILYNDNMYNHPVTIQDSLITYEITGIVVKDTKSIRVGFGLNGTGTLEVPDFKVACYRHHSWIPIDISKNKFVVDQKDTIPYSNLPVSIHSKDTVILEKNIIPFKQVPKPSDFIYNKISDSLFVYMPLTLFGDDEHTYPISDTGRLRKLNDDLNNIKNFDVRNLNDRLANVIILWNIFQHFYPNLKQSGVNWNKMLAYGLRHCYSDSTKDSYLMLLRHLVACFDDGHIYITGPTDKGYFPPFQCIWTENKLVVSKILTDNCSLKIDDIIAKINNVETSVDLDSLTNYVSASSQGLKYNRAIELLLSGEKNAAFNVQVLRNGNEEHSYVVRRTINGYDYNFIIQKNLKPYYLKINDSLFYVNFTRIPKDTLNKLLSTLQHFKNIIVDFRGYPKFGPDDWIPHVIDKKKSIPNLFYIEEIIYPDQSKNKFKSYPNRTFFPKKPKLNAKFIYLINQNAMSAAETFLYYLKKLNTSTFIGQQTGGTTGTTTNYRLTGGYGISFTGMIAKKNNNEPFQGIMPDIKVNTSIEGLKQGKDEVLEKAKYLFTIHNK